MGPCRLCWLLFCERRYSTASAISLGVPLPLPSTTASTLWVFGTRRRMPLRCWSLLLLLLCVDTIPQQRSVISDKVIYVKWEHPVAKHYATIARLFQPYYSPTLL